MFDSPPDLTSFSTPGTTSIRSIPVSTHVGTVAERRWKPKGSRHTSEWPRPLQRRWPRPEERATFDVRTHDSGAVLSLTVGADITVGRVDPVKQRASFQGYSVLQIQKGPCSHCTAGVSRSFTCTGHQAGATLACLNQPGNWEA